MNEVLEKWYCDICGEVIDDIKYGYVVWKNNNQQKSHGFKIIHQDKCDRDDCSGSAALEDFVGENGLAYLLSFLSVGPIKKNIGHGTHCEADNIDEFVDFFRRVQVPHYEEARRYFKNPDVLAEYSDAGEILPYLPTALEKIAENYK